MVVAADADAARAGLHSEMQGLEKEFLGKLGKAPQPSAQPVPALRIPKAPQSSPPRSHRPRTASTHRPREATPSGMFVEMERDRKLSYDAIISTLHPPTLQPRPPTAPPGGKRPPTASSSRRPPTASSAQRPASARGEGALPSFLQEEHYVKLRQESATAERTLLDIKVEKELRLVPNHGTLDHYHASDSTFCTACQMRSWFFRPISKRAKKGDPLGGLTPRQVRRHAAALIVQAALQTNLAKAQLRQLRLEAHAAHILHSVLRFHHLIASLMRYRRWNHWRRSAAIKIQRFWRRYRRRLMREIKVYARFRRAMLAWRQRAKHTRDVLESAVKIQGFMRRYRRMQRWHRGVNRIVWRANNRATKIQAVVRGWLARRRYYREHIRPKEIAARLARKWRNKVVVNKFRRLHGELAERVRQAAIVLQKHYRGWVARRRVQRMREEAAAARVQAVERMRLARKELARLRLLRYLGGFATKMQAVARCFLVRSHIAALRWAVALAEHAYRRKKLKKQLARLRAAAEARVLELLRTSIPEAVKVPRLEGVFCRESAILFAADQARMLELILDHRSEYRVVYVTYLMGGATTAEGAFRLNSRSWTRLMDDAAVSNRTRAVDRAGLATIFVSANRPMGPVRTFDGDNVPEPGLTLGVIGNTKARRPSMGLPPGAPGSGTAPVSEYASLTFEDFLEALVRVSVCLYPKLDIRPGASLAVMRMAKLTAEHIGPLAAKCFVQFEAAWKREPFEDADYNIRACFAANERELRKVFKTFATPPPAQNVVVGPATITPAPAPAEGAPRRRPSATPPASFAGLAERANALSIGQFLNILRVSNAIGASLSYSAAMRAFVFANKAELGSYIYGGAASPGGLTARMNMDFGAFKEAICWCSAGSPDEVTSDTVRSLLARVLRAV
eukprot:tig00000025_g7944.t1